MPFELDYAGQNFVVELDERLQIEYFIDSTESLEVNFSSANDVVSGLMARNKSIPSHYRYDDEGSRLFEQICSLPDYYLTRTETAILQGCAGKIARITGECELVELGSGNAVKTRILLDAYGLGNQVTYLPIDISAGILESSAHKLMADYPSADYPSLQVQAFVSNYELALKRLAPSRLSTRMICFLGNSLGCLAPQEYDSLLTRVAATLQPGEFFLLGVDLQKSQHQLEAAYNDFQGINAEFNLNILCHLNQRFQGNFDPRQFTHRAFYNQSIHQIELYLLSKQAQVAELNMLNLEVEFEPGEAIATGISRKFELNGIQSELQARGLVLLQVWTDLEQLFGLVLCQREESC